MRNAVNALAVALCVIVAGSIILPGVQKLREASARTKCVNNLKHTGVALENYRDLYGHFPEAAMPVAGLPPERRFSWLVSTFPMMESETLTRRLNLGAGWDAPENRFLALLADPYSRCPSSLKHPPISTLFPTNYVGMSGLGPDAADLPLEHDRAGFFGYERKHKILQSNLLAVIETTHVAGAWTAGGPSTLRGFEDDSSVIGTNGQFGGLHPGGANALFADGSVRFLRNSLDPQSLRAAATIRGSATIQPIADD